MSLRSFGFFVGSSGYERDRADLTPEQKSALEGFRFIKPTNTSVSDSIIYRLEITDDDGSGATYYAAVDDLFDRDYGGATIDFASFRPFLKTFQCVSAAQTRSWGTEPVPAWKDAPEVSTDPSCRNGAFAPYKCHQVWLRLKVPAAATHRLALERCFATMAIRIFAEDGTTELAASEPGTEGACAALTHAFAEGSYLVRIDKTNGTVSCDENNIAGDFFLRVDGAPPQLLR